MPDNRDQGLDLNQKHTKYELVEATRTRAVDLYAGSHIVKLRRDIYLFKSETETQKAYQRRLDRAVYDNWLRPPIEARQALLWNKNPVRQNFGDMEEFIEDVDGLGTPADVFFERVTEAAQVQGLAWVLIDKPGPPSTWVAPEDRKLENREVGPEQREITARTDVISLQAEKELGLRPYLQIIPGAAILDWDVGPDRKLLWAVVGQTREEKPGPGVRRLRVPQRMIWYRDHWEIWESVEEDLGEEARTKDQLLTKGEHVDPSLEGFPNSWAKTNEGPNDLGEVPLVPFYGIYEDEYLGWPVTKDVLDHVISIYNKFSDRDQGEFKTNNPIPYIISEKNPEQVAVSSDNGIWIEQQPESAGASIGYLEHSGGGIEASRTSERDLIKRIFEIMLQQSKSDTRQVQSAPSLRMESRLFNASLASVATLAEASEREAWRMFSLWQNKDFKGEIEYVKDFEDNQIAEAFLKVLSDLTEKQQLSLQTLIELLQKHEVLPPTIDVQEELRRLEDEQNRLAIPRPTAQPTQQQQQQEDDEEEEQEEDEEDGA